jgi:cytochrome c biogenesis protein CcdA
MSIDTQNFIIGISVCFVAPMVVSAFVAALICRYRIAKKRRVSAGTVFVGAVSLPLVYLILGTLFESGFWSTRDKGPGAFVILVFFGLITAICFLPAGGVVLYYQRRSKKNEPTVV